MTENAGKRLTESSAINTSLFVLHKARPHDRPRMLWHTLRRPVRIEIATAAAAVGESDRSSQVIEALNSAASVPIPYRDSKLTRILQAWPRSSCMSAHRIPTVPCRAAYGCVVQDSLGGGAKTVMVTTIAPAARLLCQVAFCGCCAVCFLACASHVSAFHRSMLLRV